MLPGVRIMCFRYIIKREDKRKVTMRLGENETEIDFVLIGKEHRRLLQNVKAIPWEFLHVLVVSDMDKKKRRNVVREIFIERRKISLLIDDRIRK